MADLTRCIRLDLGCADVCAATLRMLSRQTAYDAPANRAQVEACGDECEGHAGMHEHCRVCAEACRRCERACADLLAAMG